MEFRRLCHVPVLLALVVVMISEARPNSDQVLNVCMDGKHHEKEPATRELYGACGPWGGSACCDNQTAFHSQQAFSKLYGMNLHHCGNMSSECLKWFGLNNCFYECTPNVGPWLRPQRSFIRNEMYHGVPLCANECQSWWDACKSDFTCVENWAIDFDWGNGTNQCPEGNHCKTFAEIYKNATNFCQSVYRGDFTVSNNSSMCMVLNFTGPNPNTAVARKYAQEKGMSLDVATTTSHAPTTTVPKKDTATMTKSPVVPTVTNPQTANKTKAGVVSSPVTTIGHRTSTVIAAAVGVSVTVILALILIICKIRTSEEGVRCFPCYSWFSQSSGTTGHFRIPTDEQAFLDPDADDDCSPHGELELTL